MDTDQESRNKKQRMQYKSYGSSAMEKAIAAVQKEGKTMYRASKDFGVPFNTLRDRLIARRLLKPKCTVRHYKDQVPAEKTGQSKGANSAQFTVDDDIMERWQNIGKSQGLASATAIIEFLVSLYYSTGKQEESKTDIFCQECHKPLTLFCAHCQLVPQLALPSSTSSKRAAHQTNVSASHTRTKTPLPQCDQTEGTDPHIKTEHGGFTASPMRMRTKRTLQSCENKKTSLQSCENKKTFREAEVSHVQSKTLRLLEASQGGTKTLPEVAVSSEDSKFTLGEDSITVDALQERQEELPRNGDITNGTGDSACPLDDFLEDLQEEEEDDKKTEKARECPECGELFEDSVGLQQHLETTLHRPKHTCKLCSKSFKNKSGFMQHQRVHRRQEQQCPICGLSFRFPSRLNKHLKTHGTDRPHVCDKCGKAFISVYYLKDHIQIHSEDRPYRCEQCGATFKQKPALYAHGKIHSKEKPFQCQYCGLKYRDSQKMKIHVRTHTGERPYQCPMCDARFVSNSNMWQHCAYVHGKSTKNHQCPHCPLNFAAKGKLKIHLKNLHRVRTVRADADSEGSANSIGTEKGETDSGGTICQLEVMSGVQPIFIELPAAGNPSDTSHTSLTSVATLCHVSMSL